MSIGIFLPVRKESQRVLKKNTRKFCGVEGGLVRIKLLQLIETEGFAKVILSTDDDEARKIAREVDPKNQKITVIERPKELCLDSTPLSDLISYVPTIMSCDHICWTHVTTPFIESNDFENMANAYAKCLSEGYDSLMGVSRLQNFLFDSHGRAINFDNSDGKWPRSQDLEVIFEVNHTFFVTSRKIYLERKDRIGTNPFPYELDKVKSFDIDWEEDFRIAEVIHEKLLQDR